MLKSFYLLLDFFLPEHIADQVEIGTLFRARTVITGCMIGILATATLFLVALGFGIPLFIRINIAAICLVLGMVLVFFKTRQNNFESALNIGSFLQVTLLLWAVYFNAFYFKGMGFFALIWLLPILLMMAFSLRPNLGLILFFVNLLVLAGVCVLFQDRFFNPLIDLPKFKGIYIFYLFLVFTVCYFLAYFFVHLNDHLKEEIGKQKNLLVESAKFYSLGQMASNLAHDINNPLFTIQGKLHQIRNLFSHDELDLEKCDVIIDEVEGTILRLSQIVKGISTFARQSQADQMVSVSADDLIRGIVLIASDRIVQSGIAFDLKITPGLRVICYPSYVSQVLINLLNNAIDALEGSEVKIIQIDAFAKEKWVEIHIKDSGAGLEPGIETKVFEPFFTTKKIGKGTGLGLSISKGLVETHEGMLKYQRMGNMTDFTVYLPTYD
ncbi:MAG: GHKL domain-containing protein [Bdellovibrionales bacterium]|nr:GHKL domain-containing protein [Bdellovibrionales bacterium]